MTLARLLGIIWLLVISATEAYSQVIPPEYSSNGVDSLKMSQAAQDEFYAERRAARRKNIPRIVFVPGILGSQINECRADGSQCSNIWGTIDAIRQSDVDLSIRSDRVYHTDVVDGLFFHNVYGETLDYIRLRAESIASDSSDDPLVTVFHYDWRISNGENAKLLKERVCLVRAHAGASPIVIIAHSMGGLITKVWAERHAKEPCADAKTPDVKQIIFVATPHLGSPKAIKAIADGYNILFDELTGLKKYLGYFERNYLLTAINQAGMAFPSLYELLPIRTSEYCTKQKPALAKASVPVVGDNDTPVNLFDIETWRRYDLLRRIGTPPVRRSYYEHDLAPLLSHAEQLLCEIADFDPATVADVVYVFGREKADTTYGWFHLHSHAPDSIDNSTMVQGDGTVPVYSAQNFLVSSTRQTAEAQADHTSIIASPVVLHLIDDLFTKALQRADLQTAGANPQFASLLTAETAASGKLMPISLEPNAWSLGDDKAAIQINKDALALRGYKAADVALFASVADDQAERARLFAIAASTANTPSEQLVWIGQVARASYGAGWFPDAISNAIYVDKSAPKLLRPNDPGTLHILKTAKQVEGWAYLREGDVEKFNELASQYAAKYSVAKDDFREPILFDPPAQSSAVQGVAPPDEAPGQRMKGGRSKRLGNEGRDRR